MVDFMQLSYAFSMKSAIFSEKSIFNPQKYFFLKKAQRHCLHAISLCLLKKKEIYLKV